MSMHDGADSTLIPFHGLLQRRSELATERFKQMTKAQIREFLFYVGAVMTWVESKGVSICDIGPSNLAVNPSSSFPPRLFLCDLQDWYQGGPTQEGFLRAAEARLPRLPGGRANAQQDMVGPQAPLSQEVRRLFG